MNMYPERGALVWLYLAAIVSRWQGLHLPTNLAVTLLWLQVLAVGLCVLHDVALAHLVDDSLRDLLGGSRLIRSLWSSVTLLPPLLLVSDGWWVFFITVVLWASVAFLLRVKLTTQTV